MELSAVHALLRHRALFYLIATKKCQRSYIGSALEGGGYFSIGITNQKSSSWRLFERFTLLARGAPKTFFNEVELWLLYIDERRGSGI